MHRTAVCLFLLSRLSAQTAHPPAPANYANLPLSFEKNVGQTADEVLFLARTGAGAVGLTADGLVIEPHQSSRGPVRMALKGVRTTKASPSAEAELPGRVNYLIGPDPSRWRTGLPTFSSVRYRDVYPGIDLVYYGNQHQLEYDFLIAPGADPRSIRMDFDRAAKVRVTKAGDLVATTPGGSLTMHKPVAYQDMDGERKSVEAGFTVTANRAVAFRLGPYDRRQPLVIDPVLVFSTFLGGSVADVANAIAADPAGNIYVAGSTRSPDFPATSGAGSAFIAKLNPAGTSLIYSTYFGGSGGDAANGLAVNSAGEAYVVGETGSKDFPVTSGAFQNTFPGSRTSFAAKLNAAGSGFAYATYLGGKSSVSYLCCDAAAAVAIDDAGNATVAGTTYAAGFPVTPGAVQTKLASTLSSNAYIAKLNPSGSSLVYSTFLGGSGQVQFNIGPAVFTGDSATALAVDRAGNAYVAGSAHSADFPVTPGAFQTRNKAATTSGVASQIAGYNAFVAKINPSGSALVFSTYLGGSGVTIPNGSLGNEVIFGDRANALALDSAGNVYVSGYAYSADFPATPGAYQPRLLAAQLTQGSPLNYLNIGYNGFVAKLKPDGAGLVYSTFLGGSGSDRANAIAVDASGNAYIAGEATSADFPVTPGALQPVNKAAAANHAASAFVAQLNPSGAALLYSTFLGGSGSVTSFQQPAGDTANGLALGAANLYVAGTTSSADFPSTPGTFQPANNATGSKGQNAFVTRFDVSVPVTGVPPSIRPDLGVVGAASYAPALTPGGLGAIFGFNLASTSMAAAGLPLPNSLAGTQVKIGGVLAPLLYVSPSQINFQIPWELTGQAQASVAVTTPFGSSPVEMTMNLSTAAPAIFTANGSGSGQGLVVSLQGKLAAAATPVAPGQWVVIYCTGLGSASNRPATGAAVADASSPTVRTPLVTIGGVQATLNFAGLAPGYVGVYQVNALVPADTAPGSSVPLTLTIDGAPSNTVTIAVQ